MSGLKYARIFHAKRQEGINLKRQFLKSMDRRSDFNMDYIQKIFKRAKVKNVVDHLLYGYEPDTDITDYESRMEEAFAQYGKIADKYSGNKSSDLVDAATALTEVISAVYMEIGFQTGLLFMQEIYHNSVSGHVYVEQDRIKK